MLSVYISMIWIVASLLASALNPSIDAFRNVVYISLEQNQIHIKVHDVMKLVGLTQDPKEKAAYLSGGEIRKLAFARAIIKPWELLILDEPTTNLDESSAMQLMDIVANLHHENNTILIATHDPEVVKRCERTVLLRNGFMEITTNPSRI